MVSSRLRQEEYLAEEPPEDPPSPIYLGIDYGIEFHTDMRTSSGAVPVPTAAPTAVTSLPTSVSTSTPESSFLSITPYSVFFLGMVGILLVTRIVLMCKEHKKRRRQRQQQNEGIHSGINDAMTLPSMLRLGVQLGTEDRVELYRRAFERNTHFHKLTAEDFLLPEHENKNADDDGDDGFIIADDVDIESSGGQPFEYDGEENDSPCIYLSLQSSSSTSSTSTSPLQHQSHHPEEECTCIVVPKQDNINASSESETIVDDTATTTATTNTTTNTTTSTTIAATKTKIHGTCIICFEDFSVGETIVYSDNPDTCNHVFHEDCMVQYLASHSQRTKVGGIDNDNSNHNISRYTARYAHNPCPTCRQPFCQVSNEDLIIAVLMKSVEVALQEEQDTTNMNSVDSSFNSNSERFDVGLNMNASYSNLLIGTGLGPTPRNT